MSDDIKLPDLKPTAETPVAGLPSVIPEPVHAESQVVPEKPKEPEPVLFELRLTETSVVTGSLPITWCVDRNWLLENSRNELYILLSCAPPEQSGQGAEWRGFVKLSDMMAYVTFYRNGKNRILALVTSSKDEIERWMLRSRDEPGGWQFQAMEFPNHWDSDAVCTYLLAKRWTDYQVLSRLSNHIDVDLPAGCFAKEPSALEKRWVNFFFRNKAVDQCEFRRRRILAYTVQPIAFVLAVILYIMITTLIHVFNLMIGKWTVWENFGTGDTNIDRRIDILTIKKLGPLSWLLVPIPWIIIGSLILSSFKFLHLKMWFLMAPAYLLVVPISFGILFGFFLLITKFEKWSEVRSPRVRASKRKAMEEQMARLAIQRKEELEALELLLCSSGKRVNHLKDLPKNKRTVKLRFQGLKARVCKPFAR